MSNTFEFAERFGFSPPTSFENDSDRKGFYKGIINFIKLFNFIKEGVKNNGETTPFDYKDFISTSKATVSAREQQAMFATKDFLTFREKKYPVNVPYETETSAGQKIALEPITKLNKKIGIINTTPDHAIAFNFKKEKLYFTLFYKYNNSNEIAIEIRCEFFDQFETILKISGYKLSDADLEEDLIKNFNFGFNKVGQDPNQLDWLYEKAPIFIIVSRGTKKLLNDLSSILTTLVDEIGTNEEKVVLKIMNALAIIHFEEFKGTNYIANGADKLLETLITKKVKDSSTTLFERLYSKMNDSGFGEENFTKLMLFIYNIWLFSSWAKQESYKENNESGINNLAYTNRKILGFYQNGFDFNFINTKEGGLKIKVTRKEHQGGSIKDGTGNIVTKTIGIYHPLEPIRLPKIPENIDNETFEINKTIIPAFYLKAFDDKKAWDNFQTGSWLALDIITTFSGVGNILKFRHLTKLARLAKATKGVKDATKIAKAATVLARVKLAAGLVEFTSGIVSVLITLSQTNSKYAIALQKYLFILELFTLSGELRVAFKGGLKKYAREAIAQSDEAVRKAHPEVFRHLDEVASTKRVRLKPKIVKGKYSKRTFDINNCGGKILNLEWINTKITKEGIDIVKKHIGRFEDVEANRKMIKRLEDILSNKIDITNYDKRYYTHEIREFERYKALGYENTLQKNISDGNIYNDAHSATLEDYKLNEFDLNGNRELYHPDIEEIDFFSKEDRELLGY
ncbi:hypothetical protein [uncultured Lacinutrix sp.]|uniref:hypothetical protein n=1 Tax=uncultured Lacinutrix sp. TaxID=574032 RepID=UPI002607DF59|nr:hypothetical protein [uncultured Lacinutrix sp.]